jgi:outer membrane receptor protein involved in Fe transport
MKRILCAALSALLPAGASATEAPEEFWSFMSEEAANLTVASPTPESVFDSVSNVKVVGRAEIERYNFGSVAEALQTVPGISVTRTYLMHNIPTVRGALQEHYANKVLVMINNVPMWNAVTGEGDLDRVEIDSVERIEVLLGPASVLYGSNALTGVVNIVLRESPRSGGGHFSGGLGSGAGGYEGKAGVSRAGGSYSWKERDSSYTLSAGSRREDQPAILFTDEAGARVSVREYFEARTFNFTGRSGAGSLLLNAASGDQNYLGNSLTLASGGLFNESKEMLLAAYAYDLEPEWGNIRLSAVYDWQRRNIPRDAADDLRSEIEGSRLTVSAGAIIPLRNGFYLEAGSSREHRDALRYLNYSRQTGAPVDDNAMSGRATCETSAHLQAGYDGEKWRLLAGSRYTRDSASGENVSSRASAIYKFDVHNSLKAMFSQSFRAPTAFEQYFKPSTVTVLGNPALSPERTETWEISYLIARGKFFAHATAYRTRYTDTIFRDLGDFTRDGTAYTNVNFYANAPGYRSTGVELQARYAGRSLGGFLALEVSRGSRGDEHSIPAPGAFGLPGGTSWNFKYVPEYALSGGVSAARGRVFAASNFNIFGHSRSLRGRIGTQFWADLSAGFNAGAARHALAVRNLTGKAVEIPEYVRLKVVETLPLYAGRRLEYTFSYRF